MASLDVASLLTPPIDTVSRRRGDLNGVMLGSTMCIQSYLDKTGDIKAAAYLAVLSLAGDRGQEWVECYRDLLNERGQFKDRAR